MGAYDDILGRSRPVDPRREPMSRLNRAKQFMPFAALRGYDDVISEKQVICEPKIELGDEQRDRLDAELLRLHAALRQGLRPRVALRCFVPSAHHPPLGQHLAFTGVAEKMDLENQRLRLDGRWLPLADVVELKTEEEGGVRAFF